jgi:hypothetical protein
MNVIRLRKKNICLLILGSVLFYFILHLLQVSSFLSENGENTNKHDFIKCSKYLKWHSRKPGTIPVSQSGKAIGTLCPRLHASHLDIYKFLKFLQCMTVSCEFLAKLKVSL